MGLFKSLFGGNNTPETEKEKNDKKQVKNTLEEFMRLRNIPGDFKIRRHPRPTYG